MTSKANCLLFSLEELQAYKKISRDANPIHPAFPNCVTIITRKTAITIDI